MNNQIREIPGYYYGRCYKVQLYFLQPLNNLGNPDKEKRKYFKVLPHGAVPSSSAYSSETVKKRKLQDEKLEVRQ